eukprot:COSAG02_NODE_62764_length_265_cov_0.608434_1_plen_23_part_10
MAEAEAVVDTGGGVVEGGVAAEV